MWDSKNFTSLRSCLLQKDYHELISRSAWKITVDGNFLLDSPNNLAKCRPNIPIIIGTNKDEWAPWCKSYVDKGAPTPPSTHTHHRPKIIGDPYTRPKIIY